MVKKEVVIRKAKSSDLDEYLLMSKEFLDFFMKISKEKRIFSKKRITESFERMLKSRKNNVWILEVDKKIAGYMTLLIEHNKNRSLGYMDTVYIKKEFRGKGYGKLMAKEFMKMVKVKGCEKMGLGTRIENKKAQKLYESLGFKQIGINYGMLLK